MRRHSFFGRRFEHALSIVLIHISNYNMMPLNLDPYEYTLKRLEVAAFERSGRPNLSARDIP